jgi:hypothetical protein
MEERGPRRPWRRSGCWSRDASTTTVVIVRAVPWWGVVSSAAAPVLMAGGWTVAARLQPHSYSQIADTVSALAAPGAADRWVMTVAFLVSPGSRYDRRAHWGG